LAALAGCSEMGGTDLGGERSEGWSQAVLPNVPRDRAFDAGVHALRQWFRVEEVSRADGVARTALSEYDQMGGTGRIRDTAIGFRNRMRHQATLTVTPQGPGSVVKCMVNVERLDTADHRVFRDQQQFQDYPTETPIDRDAAISTSQDQVWTPMPRDRKLEQEILDVVRNRVATPTTQRAPA
jgi:hypothetical protein